MFGKTGDKHPNYGKGIPQILGEKNSNAKLKAEDIPIIRKLYFKDCLSLAKIAKLFNVGSTTINCVVNEKTWSHIK